MSITADKKEIIADLVIENYSLRNEIKELREKHENECRQISQYDEELEETKRMAAIYGFARMCNNYGACEECPMLELQSEQPESPKKTYKDDLFEKIPNVIFRELDCALPCRGVLYGEDIDCESRNCVDCWNEAMKSANE